MTGSADALAHKPEAGRREQAKAERRDKIVKAARDLIRETGDMNLSMRMIARRAEVSVATFYNLFGSKRAVVMAVLEDERDFLQKYQKLNVSNAIDRIFEAHKLAYGYFVKDPDFYRPLWRALLVSGSKDDTGLVSSERQAQTRAAWIALLTQAQEEGFLKPDIPPALLERTLSYAAGGALLSWTMENLSTDDLMPSVALAYATILNGSATPEGAKRLAPRIAENRRLLLRNA